jgi:hypothetical protein
MTNRVERRWTSHRRRLIRALGQAGDGLEASIEEGDPLAAAEWACLFGELGRALRIRDVSIAERSRLSSTHLRRYGRD